jgi:phosphoribosylformimino-5-aminoimidazole carboxamide ribotide isomerase
MIIFPAIDLKAGKCVRLLKGDMMQATIFNDDPLQQAQEFCNLGFKFIHIVDLDGAVSGSSQNSEIVTKILKNAKIPVQLGGGIRSLADIEKWLDLGVSRVILGTIALQNPLLVKQACIKFPHKIIVGIDARNYKVATHGWVNDSNFSVIDLARQFEDCGVSAIIYTDISRDGMLLGFDYQGTKSLAQAIKIPVIASGGISSIADLKLVEELEEYGVEGVIIGRAWYEKKITLDELRRNKLL